MMMKLSLKALACVALLAGCETTTMEKKAAPTQLWSTTGFSNPESVYQDTRRGGFYVSNLNGGPLDKDGNGFISRLNDDGSIKTLKWIEGGLNAPKGTIITGDTLYVTDIDRLVEIDLNSESIVRFYPAEGAIFLNDPAVGPDGSVYVSDIAGRKIYRRAPGAQSLDVWYAPDDLPHVNGLLVEGDKLIVAGWGVNMADDGSTEFPGNLFTIDLATKTQANLGDGRGVGNLDGLEDDGKGGFLVTDFVAGALYRIQRDGSFEQLLDLNSGSADLEVIDGGSVAVIPMMMDGAVTAWKVH